MLALIAALLVVLIGPLEVYRAVAWLSGSSLWAAVAAWVSIGGFFILAQDVGRWVAGLILPPRSRHR